MKAAILTVSDKGSRGERQDRSGPAILDFLEHFGLSVLYRDMVPDEKDQIAKKLIEWSDKDLDLILTTGGTGFSPRDVTPEATLSVLDRQAMGIAEAMRMEGLKHTNKAMLSRAVAGIRKKTLIVNLPGSRKGAIESLEAIIGALPHGIEILRGDSGDCGE
ncbi:MAG: MogA/MoaB family molybdenum cofactor biosynthesis protein [Deltaproteobacteria bacterium]|nr:MogA/MoaB family molybdenum cofactor biosynthesis protein [Deltaproteobacteria bacterium]